MEIAVHVQEGSLQWPRGLQLRAVSVVLAVAIQAGQDQAIVLGPAHPPVYVSDVVLVVRIVPRSEVLLHSWSEGEGASVAKPVVELGLYIVEIQRARFIAALAVGLVLNTRLQAQMEGALFLPEKCVTSPEQTWL